MNIPVLYLWLHKRMVKEYVNEKHLCIIERKELYYRMQELFKIPRALCSPVLKEMKNHNMVKYHNRDYVEICPIIMDPEENTSVIYLQAGVFK